MWSECKTQRICSVCVGGKVGVWVNFIEVWRRKIIKVVEMVWLAFCVCGHVCMCMCACVRVCVVCECLCVCVVCECVSVCVWCVNSGRKVTDISLGCTQS